MSIRRILLVVTATALLIPALPSSASAQIGDRLRRRAQAAVENEVGDAMVRGIRNAVRCTLDDTACAEKARRDGNTPVFVDQDGNIISDADGNPITDVDDATASVDAAGSGVWTNYDFVTGSEVVFALDLEDERVGRFPARQLEFVNGNAQIVEKDGVRMIEFTAPTTFRINLPELLADDYTLEFRYQAGVRNAWLYVANGPMPGNMGGYDFHYLNVSGVGGIYLKRQPISGSAAVDLFPDGDMVPFKLQVDHDDEIEGPDADYAIAYAGATRFAQVPTANFERSNVIEFHVTASADRPAYLSDVLVAVHGDPLYESLTSGERTFTTRGILFDFNADRLRGESTPTLEEIRRTMERSETLVLEIEGHTDASGDDEYNQSLSERRAQAVVDYLVESGISRDRLTAVGRGEADPVADNDTEAGRQQNRRVVIKNTGPM